MLSYINKYWLLIFVLPIATVAVTVLVYGVNVPFNEQWEFSASLIKMMETREEIGKELWKLHNEHRPVFPKLIMLILATLTEWNIRAELFTNILLGGGILYFLLSNVSRTLNDSIVSPTKNLVRIVFIGISLLTFSMSQAENWMWGWQIAIFLNVLMIILGFNLISKVDIWTNVDWFKAVFFGLVATFSFANGLFYWLIGLLFVIQKQNTNQNRNLIIASWIGVTVIVWGAYFYKYESVGHHPSLLYLISNPVEGIQYILGYLGSPILQYRQLIPIGVFVGFCGCILVLFLGYKLKAKRMLLNRNLAFWHMLLLYAIASDVITAVGRTGFGIEQAFSSRYTTIGNLFWFWILVVFSWQYQHRLTRFKPYAYWFVLMLLLMYTASTLKNIYKFRSRHDELIQVRSELTKKRPNFKILLNAHPNPDTVLFYNSIISKNKLSFHNLD